MIALQAAFPLIAHAADITTDTTITNSTAAQTLVSGTLTVNGILEVDGDKAVNVKAGNSAIVNNGTISSTGGKKTIDIGKAGTTFSLTNKGTIRSDNVAVRVDDDNVAYAINNQGTISVTADEVGDGKNYAVKLNPDPDTPTTGNTFVNGSANNRNATVTSNAGAAIKLGSNLLLTNYGKIFSTSAVNTSCPDYLEADCDALNDGDGAPKAGDGISIDDGDEGGANGNVAIVNHGTITGTRHGIDGGSPISTTADANLLDAKQLVFHIGANGVTFDRTDMNGNVTNGVTIANPVIINDGTITGNNGSGVGLDGHGVVFNYGTIAGNYAGAGNVYDHLGDGQTVDNGDGDGVDIDGVAYIENWGTIKGTGAGGRDSGGLPNGADGIAAGGGTIINHAGATIFGDAHGILIDDGSDGTTAAVRGTEDAEGAKIYIVNAGTITGNKGIAVGLVGNFDDTLVNSATGVITGGAQATLVGANNSTAAGAAVQMGDGKDTLTNYGRIEGRNGMAIDMGDGDDTLNLYGGTVIGTIDGGAGNNLLQTNGTQVFSGSQLSNFQNITVQGGSTTFNTALNVGGNVQIDAGGSLQVKGNIDAADLKVDGTLQTTTGNTFRTTTLSGNYTQGASGVLETHIGASDSDKIVAGGTATLDNGATIRPLITGSVTDGSSYTLISASGGLAADVANLKVAGGNGIFYSYTLETDADTLKLVAHREHGLASVVSPRFSGVANALDAIASNANSQQALDLLNAFQALPDINAVAKATEQLAPETNASAQAASMAAQGSVFSAFDNRVDAMRNGGSVAMDKSGLAAGDASGARFWVQGLVSVATQKARKGANGYDLDAQGLAVGFETDINARDMIGLSGGYTQAGSDGRDDGNGDNNDVKALHLGGYFSRTERDYTLDASVALSSNHYDSQRRVVIPGFTETLKGKYSGYQLGARVEYGIPFELNTQWSGRWLVGARAAYLDNESYTETGGASAQHVESQDAHSFQSVIGAEFVNRLDASSSATLRARYLHEFADTPAIEASFVNGGPSFKVDGVQPGRDALQLGVGYRNVTSTGTVISVGYDLEVRDRYLGHQLTARASWQF
ncbi:MAG TPA: autotransporter domain-containing protein [Oxalicibacterium sp.]|nr:autotransporter domain-containing protein [Oxalicibacterium sp.]